MIDKAVANFRYRVIRILEVVFYQVSTKHTDVNSHRLMLNDRILHWRFFVTLLFLCTRLM